MKFFQIEPRKYIMNLIKQIIDFEKRWRYRLFFFAVGSILIHCLCKHFLYILTAPEGIISATNSSTIVSHCKDCYIPKTLNKIDWHDYVLINRDLLRTGPGEQGKPAKLFAELKAYEEVLYNENGFNGALSDIISVNRSLPDLRHSGCKFKHYLESLPSVSVVVQFYNEHRRTLLRTIYSIINRSPPQLLKEVILIDDASTKKNLKVDLDEFIGSHLAKVKIIRLENRSGLITARMVGAKNATSDVIIFLDSHTEATHNWLPPLLEPIAFNYRTVVCPFINIIAFDTFEYRIHDDGARGAFDWEFYYKRLPKLPKDQDNMPDPFESPIMAGGLFAISRKFFWELGGYDTGLDIWGGEQYELSFKIWQCGGRILDAPCSCIGHIYRNFADVDLLNPKGHGDFVGRNYRRVAEVWMDEYAEYLYKRRPHYRKIDPGDLSAQKALREKLQCKSFRWFITQVAFDLAVKFPPIEPTPYASGVISPVKHPLLCVDANQGKAGEKLILMPCVAMWKAEQKFIFGWAKDIKPKNRSMCWDLPDTTPRKPVLLFTCHGEEGNQSWRYLYTKKIIVHVKSDQCLKWNLSLELFIDICDENCEFQKWNVEVVNKDMIDKWDQNRLRITKPVENFQ